MTGQPTAPVPEEAPVSPPAGSTPGELRTAPAHTSRLAAQLALWLWPVLLVGLATLYLQHRTVAIVQAAVVDRPKILIVDEIRLMERAIARGANPDDYSAVQAEVRLELEQMSGDDTIILPRQVVTAAPERLQAGVARDAE